MRVMTSLFAMLLIALMGCSKTDDSADRGAAPMEQTPPAPDETTAAPPPSDTMPPADQPPPPAARRRRLRLRRQVSEVMEG